jgi:hypothetical protein
MDKYFRDTAYEIDSEYVIKCEKERSALYPPPDLIKKVLEKQQQAEVQQEPFHVGFMRISQTQTANVVMVDAAIFSDD